jgi:glycosyltransferase involved in cell wall biosynthesis
VEDGVNGFLCRPRDVADLAEKLERMIALPPGSRVEMVRRGRAKMEREFDERIVIDRYLATIGEILNVP